MLHTKGMITNPLANVQTLCTKLEKLHFKGSAIFKGKCLSGCRSCITRRLIPLFILIYGFMGPDGSGTVRSASHSLRDPVAAWVCVCPTSLVIKFYCFFI